MSSEMRNDSLDVSMSLNDMRSFLVKSLSSVNRNKINGVLAEIEFRKYLKSLGFDDRVSVGGWIVRNTAPNFGHHTVALFPHVLEPGRDYMPNSRGEPPRGLHTICSTFHQIGIKSFFCWPRVKNKQIEWEFGQLGIPSDAGYCSIEKAFEGFTPRQRSYNFLRYNSLLNGVPEIIIPEEFSKENLRVSFQTRFMTEPSDIDGIFWGQSKTYPIEIKEKTAAKDNKMGEYFGLDLGPFVKLAFYSAKRGNLHSIFVVREIDDPETRNLKNWLYITFDKLAQYASWVPTAGGKNMLGGGSSVVKIPKAEFSVLDKNALEAL